MKTEAEEGGMQLQAKECMEVRKRFFSKAHRGEHGPANNLVSAQ
jgi:hypothetical protein